jgi:hypothetical protein
MEISEDIIREPWNLTKLITNCMVANFASALAGLIVGVIEKNTLKGIQTFGAFFEILQGQKIFEFFSEIVEAKNTSAQERQRELLESELLRAYRI